MMQKTRTDIRPSEPGAREMEGVARPTALDPLAPAKPGSPLGALSNAASDFARRGARPRFRSRRPALIVGVALSAACGLVVAFGFPLDHPCTAILTVRGSGSLSELGHIRKELLDFVWNRKGPDEEPVIPMEKWKIDAAGVNQLRLTILWSDRSKGVALVRRLTSDFLAHLELGAAALRATPTEAEAVLQESLADVGERMDDAKAAVDEAVKSLPATDPRIRRDDLTARWDSLRVDFDLVRGNVRSAVTSLEQLESSPAPSHGVVSASTRAEALTADSSLQQDLRELGLRLTEARAQLLRQGGEAQAALNQLQESERAFDEIVARTRDAALPPAMRDETNELARRAERYGQALSAFGKSWLETFSALQSTGIDPLSSDILDAHERLRSATGDFLFSANESLSAMRRHVSTLSDMQVDGTRFPILESDIVRAFHGLQAAHHRFGFASAFVESADNFRLDAAMRGARGLRRRTQDRIRIIEKGLEADAARRAREQRNADLLLADRLVRQARQTADDTVGHLVELQAQLNTAAEQSESFHSALRRLEAATSRLEAVQTHRELTVAQLDSLQSRRERAEYAPPVELASCGVSGYPVNLMERLIFGSVAGSLSLIALFSGIWINSRGVA